MAKCARSPSSSSAGDGHSSDSSNEFSSSTNASSNSKRQSTSKKEEKIVCLCGCGAPVSRWTSWRHCKQQAERANVADTTKAAFRNASPEPAFPKSVRRAAKRGGARSSQPKAKKPKTATRVQVAADADTTDPPPTNEQSTCDQESTIEQADVQNATADDNDAIFEPGSTPVPDGTGPAPSEPVAPIAAQDDDGRPQLDVFARGRYRTMVEEVEDEGDEQDGGHGRHGGDGSADESESDFSSDDESSRSSDEYLEDEPSGPSAMDQIHAEFQRQLAEMLESTPSAGLAEDDLDVLRAFAFKTENFVSRKTFKKMPRYFPGIPTASHESNRTRARFLSGVRPVKYDCCVNSCVLFVGPHAELTSCPHCKSPRRGATGQPLQQFVYMPVIPRLRAMYQNPSSAKRHMYRDTAAREHEDGVCRDYVDGLHYRELCQKFVRVDDKQRSYRYFSDPHDVALGLSTDGFAPFRKRKQTCWPLLLVDYNLDPEIRYRRENIIEIGVIPGPKQPTDFNSFLYPLVQELLELARGVNAFDGNKKCLFTLHGYLILGFGDMPAVAKLMCMKGHNGLYPCRFCKIRSLRIPDSRSPAHYIPLDRSTHPEAGDTPRYDPAALPMRTHKEMLQQALNIETAANPTRAERIGRDSGMNGMPILAPLPSIRLDRSFPIEFMHLVLLNLIPNLILLYTGLYKDLDVGDGAYEFADSVWAEIGKITGRSGSTIPSAFGARVPDMAKDKTHMIAETWLIWTMFIAPIVLRGRFLQDKYYEHFMQLVHLLERCTQLELTQGDIDLIRSGFIDWVQKFEQYFYQKDPARIATCVSTVHGLLHIADSIEAMGPVGCYWSFLMERYCSSLRPAIRSRKHPYTSIANYVVDSAHISQIRLLYNLDEYFEQRREVGEYAPAKRGEFVTPEYPSSALMRPSLVYELTEAERRKISKHLSVRFGNADAKQLVKHVPKKLETWGRVRRLDGGDTIVARQAVRLRHDNRDTSYIRYTLEEDKYAKFRNRRPVYVQRVYFGQLQRIFVLPLPALPRFGQDEPQVLLLALVSECDGLSKPDAHGVVDYSGKLKASEVIDLAAIECLVGRVEDRGRWGIVDRSIALTRVVIPEDDEDEQ